MKKFVPLFLLLVLFLVIPAIGAEQATIPPDLDNYLNLADNSFAWKLLDVEKRENGTKIFNVELTSQTWHGIVWKHALCIVQPAKVFDENYCLLYITGGNNKEGEATPKRGEDETNIMIQAAEQSGMTIALLFQVPNQPLLGPYVEDALISETFLRVLAENDTTWSLLFPMCKSALRAMDAVQQVLKQEENRNIEGFIVGGGSKRGWTTWLVGAAQDKRVIAIVPIVINTLNIPKQLPYHVETWGRYSEMINDYVVRNLVDDLNPEKAKLFPIVDPYSYRSRITMPKLIVNGANDPYWTVDAMKFYWDDLVGPKYSITLPNAGHALDDQVIKALYTILTFARYACSGGPWPEMSWTRDVSDNDYTVSVFTEIPVKSAKVWSAKSGSKDLRKSKWTSKPVAWRDGYCKVTIPKPEIGHIAYYVELEIETPDGMTAHLTTQVWRDGE
ncbi:MAG: PhoPQ-activated pathogenicity-related family protein [Thermoguttaceae bacterium]